MRLYRLLMALLLPVMVAHTLWQRLRGRMPAGALAAHLGIGGIKAAGPRLWLHGASNGELTSARWVLTRLMVDRPDLSVVVTCNSASAREMVTGWAMPQVDVCFAPFDTAGCVRRFLTGWQPDALIVLESEFWPERMHQMAARGPVVLLGARLSAGSARNWARFAPLLMRQVLGQLHAVSAQDAESQARLEALGLKPAQVLPRLMLKSRLERPLPMPAPFEPPCVRERILLAASTHEGEDHMILSAFAQARAAGRFDFLIIAPRHPKRAPAIAALAQAQGLGVAMRSKGEDPGAGVPVYLADTLGEMPMWYEMAGSVFIGASLVDLGGHTPYEPALFGAALLHGPSTANFAEAYGALRAADAAIAVQDSADLTQVLMHITPEEITRLAKAAQAVLTPQEDEAQVLAALHAALPVARSV